MSTLELAVLPLAAPLLAQLGMADAYERGCALLGQIAIFEAESALRLDQLASEVDGGLWCGRSQHHALAQARQQQALRAKDPARSIAAHASRRNLPIEPSSIVIVGQQLPSDKQLAQLLRFFDAARQAGAPPFWTASLLREAELHLYDLIVAAKHQQLREAWQPIVAALRAYIAMGNPDPTAAYLQLLDLLYQLGDLRDFLETYAAFRRHSGASGQPFPWLSPARSKLTPPELLRLLDQVITVRSLLNRSRDHQLAVLLQLRDQLRCRAGERAGAVLGAQAQAPATDRVSVGKDGMSGLPIQPAQSAMPMPNTIGCWLPEDCGPLIAILEQVVVALAGGSAWDRRRREVLRFWLALLYRHTYDLARSRDMLDDVRGGEALALLKFCLGGELAFFAGDYERAQLCHSRALQLASRLLKRFQSGACRAADTGALKAAQRCLGKLHQWRGNTFAALGSYQRARDDYAGVERYLGDCSAEARLTGAINRGNLEFLRHRLNDQRGFVAYASEERALLGAADVAPFARLKLQRDRQALEAAERHYRAAETMLAGLGRGRAAQLRWQALIAINLGNVAWARARLLAERANLLGGRAKPGLPSQHYQHARERYYQAYQAAHASDAERTHGSAGGTLAAACLAGAAELSLLLGDISAAEVAAFESLRLLGYPIRNDFDDLLDDAQEPRPEQAWRIYLTLARVYQARDQHTQAWRAYERALATVELLRDLVRSSEWQISALQSKLEVYESAMHFCYQADPSTRAERIFALGERLKAHSFLELLASSRLNLDALVSPAQREQRAGLAAKLAQATEALRQAKDEDFERCCEVLNQYEADWQLLESEIAAHQLAADAGLATEPLDWPALQQALAQRPDTIVLSFVLGDAGSYLLVGDASKLDVFELPGRAHVELAVQHMLWLVSGGEGKTAEYARANQALAKLLLGEAIERAQLLERMAGKRIVILPDGLLYYLPFALLLVRPLADAQGRPLNLADYQVVGPEKLDRLRQLCRDLLPFTMLQVGPISYAQSASVWQELERAPLEAPGRTALGVYGIDYTSKRAIGRAAHTLGIDGLFPFSNAHVVARLLDQLEPDPAAVIRLTMLVPEQGLVALTPTEGNFKQALNKNKVRYVLFAGHGVYNDQYPQFSGLIFNMPRRSRGICEDGFFQLQDVFDLDMGGTELVFLAACQSGVGAVARGEGINALTRALMYRGSPTVVASLWSVDERATMRLVELFFERLRAEPAADKATLLQSAQQALSAQSAEHAHPLWWAGFIVMGRR